MDISRRDFVRIGAGGITVSLMFGDLLKADPLTASGRRMIVVLQMTGGNDSLNTFIPYTDPVYRSARPNVAIADKDIVKVSDRMGFHPALSPLVPLYQGGKFAFINNVGFASLDRSHFRCRDVWQTGIELSGPAPRGTRGWLGRYADTYLADGATAVTTFAVDGRMPVGLAAANVSGTTITNPDAFDSTTDLVVDPADPDRERYKAALAEIYAQQRSATTVEFIRGRGNSAFLAVDLFKRLGPAGAASYPATSLGKTLQLIARIAAAGIGTTICWVSIEGFDTHGLQPQTQAKLLGDIAGSLASFQEDVTTRGLSRDILVLGWSEFGRRIYENGFTGTEHGKAGSVFVLGDGVKGGVYYGGVPDLARPDDGDVPTQIDFRSVYSTIIQDWFGRDPLPVLDRAYENLGFMQRAAGRTRLVRH